MNLKNVKVGDNVIIGGDSGFCAPDYTYKVTEITIKYDENTGEQYNVIHCGDRLFESRNGQAISPPLAYYIKRNVL